MRQQIIIIYITVALLTTQLFIGYVGIPLMSGNQFPADYNPDIIILGENGRLIAQGDDTPHSDGKSDGKLPVVVESEKSVSRREALKRDLDKGLFILVNKQNPVDSSYKPEDLTAIKYFAPDRPPEGRVMRKEAAEAFNKLSEAAAKKGHTIIVTTAYRSYDFQSNLYNNYVKYHGKKEADTFSAQPGKSEHQTGLAADVSSPSVNYQLTKDYINTPEGKWLNDNAYKFGFIIRFPNGKENITGYVYEPWHIRYVGKTAAKEIFNEGLTLEEYLEKEI
ncbi:M15 family metallopeptidase [Aminipila terrae]|nr:M15 family metallopeptidase [Aminipila terrae]